MATPPSSFSPCETNVTAPIEILPATLVPPGEEVFMQYGDLVLRYRSEDGSARFSLPHEYVEFRVPPAPSPTLVVDWRMGALAPPAAAPDISTERWDYWREDADRDRMVFFRSEERVPYLEMTLDASAGRASVVQDGERAGSDLADVGQYPMSEILASRALAWLDAVNLHASAAVIDGEAYLFMGHSGAGKTTISGIAEQEGATILSDDRTILGVRDGRPIAWGTPWHGTGRKSSSRTAPVAGIFLLRQAAVEEAERLDPGRAFKEMFVRLIHQRLTPRESFGALETLQALASAAPMWELAFRPLPAAVHCAVDAARAAQRKS